MSHFGTVVVSPYRYSSILPFQYSGRVEWWCVCNHLTILELWNDGMVKSYVVKRLAQRKGVALEIEVSTPPSVHAVQWFDLLEQRHFFDSFETTCLYLHEIDTSSILVGWNGNAVDADVCLVLTDIINQSSYYVIKLD